MFKAVVFDLNGVFLESRLLTERILEEYNIPIEESLATLKESMKVVRLDSSARVFDFWKKLFDAHRIEVTESEFLDFWFKGEKLSKVVLDYVKGLQNSGVRVFIFSNNFRERTEYYRANFPEIFNSVERAFFSWETGYVKSDVRAYEFLLKEIGCLPQEVVYFDDSAENIELAKSIGIDGHIYEGIDGVKRVLGKGLGK